MLGLRVELHVAYVDHRALQDRPACEKGPGWARRVYAVRLLEGFGGVVVLGDVMDQLAVKLKDRAEESVTQPHRASDNRVEDRLHVGLGAADHPQDLSRRRLLLEGFGSLSMSLCKGEVLFLQLGEEADVLDGDDGLVGEACCSA